MASTLVCSNIMLYNLEKVDTVLIPVKTQANPISRELWDSWPWLVISSAVDREILRVYEACIKFPIGGMYATLAQAL